MKFKLQRSSSGYFIVVGNANGERISVLGFYDPRRKVLYFSFGKYQYFLARGAKTSVGVYRILSYFFPRRLFSSILSSGSALCG